MNLVSIDFFLIRKNLVVFLVLLALSAGIIYLTDSWLEDSERDYKKEQDAIQAAREKLHTRQQALRVFEQIKPELSVLSGFSYDKADKLKWLEYIQRLSEQLQLPMMTYQIKARKEDDVLSDALQGTDETVYVTAIEFQAGLVYDEQLLQLLDGLKRADLGLFSVEQCELALQAKTAEFKPRQTNLTANCMLAWYEVDKKAPMDDMYGGMPGDM